jgi:hypothetical protein
MIATLEKFAMGAVCVALAVFLRGWASVKRLTVHESVKGP